MRPTLADAFATALEHHQAGRLAEAEPIYRQILAADPRHADALHLLGVIAFQCGQHPLAVQHIRRAIELRPNEAAFHANLGNALKALGALEEAIVAHRRSIELNPGLAESHINLGAAFQARGQFDEAAESYRRAIEIKPNLAQAHSNLGTILHEQGKFDEAIAAYRRAVELNPVNTVVHFNLGNAYRELGKLSDAVLAYRQAVELKPDYLQAFNNLGSTFQDLGQFDDAMQCFRRALETDSDDAEAQYNLANLLQNQGKLDEAVARYRAALALRPDLAEARMNLGNAVLSQGHLDEAVACLNRARDLNPDSADVHYNLANALNDQGNLDEAVAYYRQAVQRRPNYHEAWSNLALALQYRPGTTLAELAAAHAEFNRLQCEPLKATWLPHANDRDPDRRIRVGFVSPDFGQHPIGFFLALVLEHLDRGRFETVCYSDRINQDEFTARLKAASNSWRDVQGCGDEAVAQAIRSDGIDILFDLTGHTAHNRLLVFARKPAPIQVTWAGYPSTTGLTAIDYILADRYHIPPESEPYFCERVLRMPDGYVCYDPPAYAPPVAPLPAQANGFITFGSFNNRTKINPQVIKVWAHILLRLPHSRLVLKYRGMDDPSVANPLRNEFSRHGIDPKRIDFLKATPHADSLAEYNRIDLALDPFPYSGGLTTCEALWMGVPVVTCPGETFASRHTLSHLSNIGVTETVATNLDEYVNLAESLALDLPRLAELRSSLRPRMAASPLCDGMRFAANLALILREVWRRWCENSL